MTDNKLTRRQFLKGSGGFFLSLPFLPSLFTRELFASVAATNIDKCFFAMGTTHGGVDDRDLFGSVLSYAGTAPTSLSKYTFLSSGVDSGFSFPEHVFHYGDLVKYLQTAQQAGEVEDPDGGRTRLSYVLGSKFNSLLPKMNLLRGIDLHCGATGHQSGLFLGNFANIQDDRPAMPSAPTIDHVMINSGDFYKSLDGVTQKQIGIPIGKNISYDSTGAAARFGSEYTSNLFNALFSKSTDAVQDKKRAVVDRVFEDYTRFLSPMTSTGKRIGTGDRQDLDRFLTTLNELERKLNTQASCSPDPLTRNLRIPSNFSNHDIIWEDLAKVMALSFACGSSRIFTAFIDDRCLSRLSSLKATYHQDVAHNHQSSEARKHHRLFHRIAAEEAFYKVISTLDQYSGAIAGTTMLDQSLCTWQAESGIQTHNPINNFAVTAGGAGGYFNTGRFIDFRSLENKAFSSGFHNMGGRPGISLNQYLGNILMAMGIPRSKYEDIEKFGGPGYGGWMINPKFGKMNNQIGFPQVLINRSGDKIPIWTKA